MADLEAQNFRQFFLELHGNHPFPWQEALASRVCTSNWPEVIDLPTASGKTACIDIALFAMALQGGEAPRRVFFVVDRRVVVNEAYERMKGIREKLNKAEAGLLAAVAGRLRELAGGEEPLRVYEMRGGAFRDETWVSNPLQPTVVASTVDQVGSRLLFRGYGVSQHSWPIHAGLIGNDALIILDEAHCSRAFAQTLQRVEKYRGDRWADDPIRAPFSFVEMTATPGRDSEDRFCITEADRRDEVFKRRLRASKPTRLKEVKSKQDDFTKLADELVSQAIELAKSAEAKRIAILLNRVGTAKTVYKELREKVKDAAVQLVIGRMRAVDRDTLYAQTLTKLKCGAPRRPGDPVTFVVSTQCLEVGADLDFDVLVSECASIDALQQRFGRLDRLGEFGRARGAIVICSWQATAKNPDPIYGEALSKSWEWLEKIGGDAREVNMGIEAPDGQPPTIPELLVSVDSEVMRMGGVDSPVLLPAHLDAFAQTSPSPTPDPLIEAFLHGPARGMPDVYVVWRADLDYQASDEEWIEIVRLCPPSSRETMPVPIGTFKKWLAGGREIDDQESDLPVGGQQGELGQSRAIRAVDWRGEESAVIKNVRDVSPGHTLILPLSDRGWGELGHIPDGAPIDVGDQAAFAIRRSVSLRLHPKVVGEWPLMKEDLQTPASRAVLDYAREDSAELNEMERKLREYMKELDAESEPWPYAFLNQLDQLRRKKLDAYPKQGPGYVLEARRAAQSQPSSERVLLDKHLADVEHAIGRIAPGIEARLKAALMAAARFHDYGKADVRYQAWLLGGDLMAARFAPKLVAKSGSAPVGKQESVGLPKGFRHELLSLMFAERSADVNGENRELILHLVASHHGRCRPFAPVTQDERAECVSCGGISICRRERVESAPCRLDSAVADRFWRLTRRYGWWGLAYLEALLRLADRRASEEEVAEVSD